jgi:hypothetical protein
MFCESLPNWHPMNVGQPNDSEVGANNSNFTMVYGTYNYSIPGVYKQTNITGGHHPAWLFPNL